MTMGGSRGTEQRWVVRRIRLIYDTGSQGDFHHIRACCRCVGTGN